MEHLTGVAVVRVNSNHLGFDVFYLSPIRTEPPSKP